MSVLILWKTLWCLSAMGCGGVWDIYERYVLVFLCLSPLPNSCLPSFSANYYSPLLSKKFDTHRSMFQADEGSYDLFWWYGLVTFHSYKRWMFMWIRLIMLAHLLTFLLETDRLERSIIFLSHYFAVPGENRGVLLGFCMHCLFLNPEK